MAWIIWLFAAVVLGLAELASMAFVCLMLGGGAAAAALSAALGAPIELQVATFVVVSALALIGVRPYAKKLREHSSETDADIGLQAIEGGTALVLEHIDKHNGLIKIHGQEWTARPVDPQLEYEAGGEVSIVEIRGATAMVLRL
ncbi:MAG TPA: NfeD family protein [Candidatus Stackebrandtia faecavium]|nr:NfeD family protein [Candidatus Stackebrandtia faecavium]